MKRHPWKGILVLLAIFSLAIASRSFAQQSSGASNGLYPVPDAGPTRSPRPARPSADAYMSSLDSEGDRYQRDLEKAEAARQQTTAAARRLKDLDPDDGSHSLGSSLSPAQRDWIAILAAVGSSFRWPPSDTCGGLAPGRPGPRRRSSWPLSPTLPPNPTAPKSKTRPQNVAPHDTSPDSHLLAQTLSELA